MLINNFEDFETFLINQIQSRKRIISNILPNNVRQNSYDFNTITETYSNDFFTEILSNCRSWKEKNRNEQFADYLFQFLCFITLNNKITHNNIKDFKYLLKNLNLNIKNNNGETLLKLASKYNNIDMAKIILRDGNFEITNDENNDKILSSLGWAVKWNNIDMVKLLMSNGINIENNLGILQLAITNNNIDMIKWLLEHGADINYKNTSLHSPLHRAIIYNYVDIVKLLLEYNPDLNIKDSGYNMTPLSLAVFKECEEIKSLLNDYISKQNNDIEINNLQHFITEPINAIDLENQPSTSGVRPSSPTLQ